jgi:hypothetical protein
VCDVCGGDYHFTCAGLEILPRLSFKCQDCLDEIEWNTRKDFDLHNAIKVEFIRECDIGNCGKCICDHLRIIMCISVSYSKETQPCGRGVLQPSTTIRIGVAGVFDEGIHAGQECILTLCY